MEKGNGDSAPADRANPPDHHHPPPLNSEESAVKAADIIIACGPPADGGKLAALATSRGGLLTDQHRRVAWPLLLGCSVTPSASHEIGPTPDWRDLPRHRDEDQVKLDVNRSFVYYPNDESEQQLDRRKEELSDVITQVLRSHPMLCYFQGFHDIVQVILLVLGKAKAADVVAHLALLRIRDFMLPSLSASLAHLRLLPAILHTVDSRLCQHLSGTQPFFALAATLTLYAHEIEDYGEIARLFDFLLAHEAAVSLYLFAAIILSRRDELFEIPADEPEMLHFTLSKLPKSLDFDNLIQEAMRLFEEHPPEHLPFRSWSHVSAFSVLKTTRGPMASQSLEEGEDLFSQQALQIRRDELQQRAKRVMWKYRRPAGSLGLTILIGVLSFWLRRNGMDSLTVHGWRRVVDLFWFLRRT